MAKLDPKKDVETQAADALRDAIAFYKAAGWNKATMVAAVITLFGVVDAAR